MRACVTNIQRFSIHDGPGIRTTVFFKGCNLGCLWCHNPETQRKEPQLLFYQHKCVGCGACKAFCEKAFTDSCVSCGGCVQVCRQGAREVSGSSMSVDEVFEEIGKDLDFYQVSGGGVTFSGGEPLLQYEFLREILKRCREQNLHTAIETAGNVPWKIIEGLLLDLDLILYDIKAVDEEKHREFTGVSNRIILENARKLMEAAPEKVRFRMPVIPGLNDSEVEAAARFTRGISLELLPYHSIGMGKYQALGRKYELSEVQAPSAEYMKALSSGYAHVFCEGNLV